MNRVFTTKLAVFFHLELVGCFLLVLGGGIIPPLTLGTIKIDGYSHGTTFTASLCTPVWLHIRFLSSGPSRMAGRAEAEKRIQSNVPRRRGVILRFRTLRPIQQYDRLRGWRSAVLFPSQSE